MSELPPAQPESPYFVGGDVAPDNVVPFPGSLEDLSARLADAEAKAAAKEPRARDREELVCLLVAQPFVGSNKL